MFWYRFNWQGSCAAVGMGPWEPRSTSGGVPFSATRLSFQLDFHAGIARESSPATGSMCDPLVQEMPSINIGTRAFHTNMPKEQMNDKRRLLWQRSREVAVICRAPSVLSSFCVRSCFIHRKALPLVLSRERF